MKILRSACHHSRGRRMAALGAASILVLAACGDDDEDDAAPAATDAVPAVTDAPATDAPATDAPATDAPATDAPATTASAQRGDYAVADTNAPASAASGVILADTSLGQVVAADDGMTVYMFLPDNAGAPTCVADCAKAWPPLLVDDGATPAGAEGIDAALLGTADNPEGGTQVTYNGWPLYYYAADSAPGDTNGQGVGDVWYVLGGDGEPIE